MPERNTMWWWWTAFKCMLGWHQWQYRSHHFSENYNGGTDTKVIYECRWCHERRGVWEEAW